MTEDSKVTVIISRTSVGREEPHTCASFLGNLGTPSAEEAKAGSIVVTLVWLEYIEWERKGSKVSNFAFLQYSEL